MPALQNSHGRRRRPGPSLQLPAPFVSSASAKPSSAPRTSSKRRSTRSEEHTSELQSLMRISYAVFCLKKKNNMNYNHENHTKISDYRIRQYQPSSQQYHNRYTTTE